MRWTFSHSSSLTSSVCSDSPPMPAQQTSTSRRGSRSTAAFSCAESRTSSPFARSKTLTSAPPARSRSTVAAPMPLAPPVTSATRPSKPYWLLIADFYTVLDMAFDPSSDYPLGSSRPDLVRTPGGLALDELELHGENVTSE